MFQEPRGRAVGERSVEFVEQVLSIIEAPAISIEAGFAQNADRDPGFASPGRTSVIVPGVRRARFTSVIRTTLGLDSW
jgi:hypothetical protein